MDTLNKKFLTVDEAAVFLGFSKAYVYKLVFTRAIPCYKPNKGRVLFDARELEGWIQRGRVATVDELEARADAIINQRGAK